MIFFSLDSFLLCRISCRNHLLLHSTEYFRLHWCTWKKKSFEKRCLWKWMLRKGARQRRGCSMNGIEMKNQFNGTHVCIYVVFMMLSRLWFCHFTVMSHSFIEEVQTCSHKNNYIVDCVKLNLFCTISGSFPIENDIHFLEMMFFHGNRNRFQHRMRQSIRYRSWLIVKSNIVMATKSLPNSVQAISMCNDVSESGVRPKMLN